jgi:hypothetical protein
MSTVPRRWERERIEELRAASEVLLSATNYAETYWGRLRVTHAIDALYDEARERVAASLLPDTPEALGVGEAADE